MSPTVKLMTFLALVVMLTGTSMLPLYAANPATARILLDRTNPRAGEAFLLTVEIRITGDTLDKEISLTSLPDAGALQIRAFEELPLESANQGGQPVEIRRFRTWARAMKAGTVTVAPRLDATLVQTTRTHFFMQETRRPLQIPVSPLTITALPLPDEGRTPGFSGLVGNYTFRVDAAPLDIAPGDLITLTFTIEGDWLPETYALPHASSIPGLRAYETRGAPRESSLTRTVYRQIVVPEDNTLRELPSISLSYFDTRESRYRTVVAGPFPLRHHAEQVSTYRVYTPPQQPPEPVTEELPVAVSTGVPAAKSLWSRLLARMQGHRIVAITGTEEAIARFAPSDTSSELFALKPGTVVTAESVVDDWVRISCAQGIGWVRETSVSGERD